MIQISESWFESHPGAALGILALNNVIPAAETDRLEQKKSLLENQLRARFQDQNRASIRSLPEMEAYTKYYRRFKKTYHILLQLESITQKNKPIPRGPVLVQVMFMAEMESFLLTAGHDLDKIRGPINLASSNGEEVYKLLRGDTTSCKAGDMIMSDQLGVICSIIYGQDSRTSIANETENVLYVTYIPPGITEQMIDHHLDELEQNVALISPSATIAHREIFFA